MSDILSGLTRDFSPVPRESSSLLSQREPTGPAGNWKHIAQAQKQSSALNNLVSLVNRQTSRGDNSADQGYNMHPFKVYNVSANPENSPDANSWRDFYVRTGCVIESGYPLYTQVYRSDIDNFYTSGLPGITHGSDEIPYITQNVLGTWDSATYPGQFPSDGLVRADLASVTWVWLELLTDSPSNYELTGARLRYSAAPASNGWENYPAANPYIIPLATLDARRFADQKYTIVNQIVTGNVVIDPTMMRYQGLTSRSAPFTYGSRGAPKNAVVVDNSGGGKKTYVSRLWFNDKALTDTDGWDYISAS